MSGRNNTRTSRPRGLATRRAQVCEETARIMLEQGVRDFQLAKTKAVERLGVGSRMPLPTNREIEQALAQRSRLFNTEKLNAHRKRLLGAAIGIMNLLQEFEPRLVGSTVRGTVTERTPVELHVFSDTVEDVLYCLDQNDLNATSFEKRARYPRKRYVNVPGFWFDFNEIRSEILVFPDNGIRQAPLCPVSARPMQRTRLQQVIELATDI